MGVRSSAVLRSVGGGDSSAAGLVEQADRDLLHGMVRRDEGSLRELYRRYGSLAFGLALRVTRDRTLAEDVVQDVFVAVWERAASFDDARGSVRSWLLTQVHHRAVDLVRRETSSRRRNLVLTLPDPDREPVDTDRIVEEDWIAHRRTEVRAALSGLPAEQQQVLDLAYFQGCTQREIAERLSVPLGTVKSRTITGLRTLRARLDHGKEEG